MSKSVFAHDIVDMMSNQVVMFIQNDHTVKCVLVFHHQLIMHRYKVKNSDTTPPEDPACFRNYNRLRLRRATFEIKSESIRKKLMPLKDGAVIDNYLFQSLAKDIRLLNTMEETVFREYIRMIDIHIDHLVSEKHREGGKENTL